MCLPIEARQHKQQTNIFIVILSTWSIEVTGIWKNAIKLYSFSVLGKNVHSVTIKTYLSVHLQTPPNEMARYSEWGELEARPDIRGLFYDTIAASLCSAVTFCYYCCCTTWDTNIKLRPYEFTYSNLNVLSKCHAKFHKKARRRLNTKIHVTNCL